MSRTRLIALLVLVGAVAACGAPVVPTPTLAPRLTLSVPIPTTNKSVILAAVDVLSERLRSLGVGNVSSSSGTSLTFEVPFDGTVDRATIDAALRTPGVVSVIGWTGEDGDPPQAGDPAPIGGTSVFDAAQITSGSVVKPSEAGGNPGVEITLDSAGTQALATWSKAHIGDYLVVVVDGTVLDSAMVMSDLADGQVVLSFPAGTSIRPEVIAAILSSGPLPPGWIAP